MSDANIFTPLVDGLFDLGKIIYRTITGNKYDFNSLFKNMKFKNVDEVYPKLYKKYDTEFFECYRFTVPVGHSINDFEKKSAAFAQFFRVDEERIRFSNSGPLVEIKVLKDGKLNFDYDTEKMRSKNFKIPLGRRMDNSEICYWDCIAARNTHCYIAGSTGGGKSVMLRLILSHLINSFGPSDVQLLLQNTKYVDLKIFKNARNTIKYNEGREGLIELLDDEILEMERRYKLIDKHDCDDIAEYRKTVTKMPYRFIVIEEISSFKTDADGKHNKEFYLKLEDLSARGRGSGQILILTTQLPSKDILPNFIKNNINSTIGLMCKDQIRSEIVAGPDSGLEKLKGDGHAKLFNDDIEFQGFFMRKEQALDIVNSNLKRGV